MDFLYCNIPIFIQIEGSKAYIIIYKYEFTNLFIEDSNWQISKYIVSKLEKKFKQTFIKINNKEEEYEEVYFKDKYQCLGFIEIDKIEHPSLNIYILIY